MSLLRQNAEKGVGDVLHAWLYLRGKPRDVICRGALLAFQHISLYRALKQPRRASRRATTRQLQLRDTYISAQWLRTLGAATNN